MISRPVSIVDIAEATGVSRSAVSRALNDQPGVNPAIRQQIKDAAARLGYIKDFRATALKTQHTRTVGVLVRASQLASYAPFITTVQQRLADQGYRLAITTQDDDEAAWQFLLGLRPEAVIVASSRIDEALIVGAAERLPILQTAPQAPPGVSAVGLGTRAAEALVRAVVRAGHDKVAVLTCPSSQTLTARAQALLAELGSRAVTVVEVPVADDAPNPDDVAAVLPQVTAVMAPSDELALACWQQVSAASRVVTGFGGDPRTQLMGITTVAFPVEEAGLWTANHLLERLAQPELAAQTVLFEGECVIGGDLQPTAEGTSKSQRRIGAW